MCFFFMITICCNICETCVKEEESVDVCFLLSKMFEGESPIITESIFSWNESGH